MPRRVSAFDAFHIPSAISNTQGTAIKNWSQVAIPPVNQVPARSAMGRKPTFATGWKADILPRGLSRLIEPNHVGRLSSGRGGVTSMTSVDRPRSPLKFFVLVFALAVPIGLAGSSLGVVGVMKIPIADLGLAFVPMIAALILVATEKGWRGAGGLLKQIFELNALRDPRWLFATLGLAPLIYLLTWALVRVSGGEGTAEINPANMVLFAVFFLLAIGEEVGWTGYATEPLQSRWGALGAALILAVPWWLAHLPSMAAVGATVTDMAWWVLGAVGVRVLIIWLFNNTAKSILAAVLFHALLNAGRVATFPAAGSHYAPHYQIASYLVIGALAAAVVLVWGPKSLRRPVKLRDQG